MADRIEVNSKEDLINLLGDMVLCFNNGHLPTAIAICNSYKKYAPDITEYNGIPVQFYNEQLANERIIIV